jgi:hypothetical protein
MGLGRRLPLGRALLRSVLGGLLTLVVAVKHEHGDGRRLAACTGALLSVLSSPSVRDSVMPNRPDPLNVVVAI